MEKEKKMERISLACLAVSDLTAVPIGLALYDFIEFRILYMLPLFIGMSCFGIIEAVREYKKKK